MSGELLYGVDRSQPRVHFLFSASAAATQWGWGKEGRQNLMLGQALVEVLATSEHERRPILVLESRLLEGVPAVQAEDVRSSPFMPRPLVAPIAMSALILGTFLHPAIDVLAIDSPLGAHERSTPGAKVLLSKTDKIREGAYLRGLGWTLGSLGYTPLCPAEQASEEGQALIRGRRLWATVTLPELGL